jgi:glycine oxidase
MDDLKGLRVVVAGAGAVGSVTALILLRCGAEVVLADAAAAADNASGVAAGMLAPAFEALLDPVAEHHFPLLAVARDAWPDLAASLPGGRGLIDRGGALYAAPDDDDLQRRAHRMAALDPASEILTAAQARVLSPGLDLSRPALFSALDWRLEPQIVLRALHDAFRAEGGRAEPHAVIGWSTGCAEVGSGESVSADVLVLATGAGGYMDKGVAELNLLTPIKGQILRFDGSIPLAGPAVRAPGIYVAPSRGGAMAGASMQEGRRDLDIEPEIAEGLRARASALFPSLARADRTARAGVRAATPDGLPMVGFAAGVPGVMMAVGARRNGWLLAPVMADVVAGYLRTVPRGAFAEAFDPARFVIH